MKVYLIAICFLHSFIFAGEFEPQLNKRDKLLNTSSFEKGKGESGVGVNWFIGHQKWTVIDKNTVQGVKSQDDHSAGLRTHVGTLPNRLILEYTFRFDETPNNKGKHKLNVRFMGNGKALVFHPTQSEISLRTQLKDKGSKVLAKKEVKLVQGKWYSVMLEIRDEEFCLQMTGIEACKGSHEQIKARTKKFMAFNVGGAQTTIKNVKVWECK